MESSVLAAVIARSTPRSSAACWRIDDPRPGQMRVERVGQVAAEQLAGLTQAIEPDGSNGPRERA